MEEGGKRRIEGELEENEKLLISYLRDLVRIPTFVPPGENYEEIVDFLIPLFEGLGFKCKRIELPEEVYEKRQRREDLKGRRVNLIANKNYDAKKTLIIYTHLDVVPPGDDSEWYSNPFEAVIKENRIYGRGVADSKGAVASLLVALKIMEENELRSKYNLLVALTTDEEIGPYSGLCYLADEGFLRGDFFLSMDGDNDGIGIATNGVMNWEVKVYGKSCHSSTPFFGINAIERAMVVMKELKEMKKRVESRESKAPCSPYIAEKMGYKHIRPVLNITMISGGIKENIIPERCTIKGDRRYIPEESPEGVIKEFEEVMEDIKRRYGIELEWSCSDIYPAMFTDPEDEWVREVREKASSAFGENKEIIGVQGSLDVAYAVKRLRNTSCCFFGVGSSMESNAHAANENVRIEDLKNYTRFLIYLLV
ncbi:MAG: M20 family metallopeptidase [Candidatus Methanospirareceae archaeon]